MPRIVLIILAYVMAALPLSANVNIQEVTSPGGIKAWLVQEPSIPMISMQIGFEGGASLDPVGKEGVTSMMMGLLEEGTGDLDAAAFRRETEELASSFGFDSNRSTVSVSVEMLKATAEPTLALLRRAVVEPAFNQVAIDRVRGQMLSIVAQEETDPDKIAGRGLNALAFPGHAYSRPPDGTADSINGITQDDLFAAHAAAMTKDRLVIGVVGDVTADELGPMLDMLLGDLPQSGGVDVPFAPFEATGGTTVIDFDTPQSVAVWGQPGIDRDDPLYFASYIMNHILGGGSFSSRLTKEVREKRGLTYGVYSYVANMEHAEFVGGQVASANDRIAEAIDVIKAEWQRMAEEGVTAEELEAAKKYITGSYPLRFDGNGQIARILVGMQVQDLPIDYAATRNDRMNAVTQDEVAAVAKQLLDVDALRFVVVGQPEGVIATD